MAEEVYMDIPQVQSMANTFGTIAEVLQAVSRSLEVISTVLKTTAFMGLVGGYAVAAYIDRIQPRINQAAEKMEELQLDVYGAIVAYRDADMSGSQRFV